MRRAIRVGILMAFGVLLAASLPAQAQEVTDTIVVGSYVSIKPQAAGDWAVSFKKYFVPVIEELRTQGDVLGYKDRAAQGRAEKRIGEVLGKMPAGEAQKFMGVIDMDKHSDIEWREVDFSKVTVPEEKKEEKKEE